MAMCFACGIEQETETAGYCAICKAYVCERFEKVEGCLCLACAHNVEARLLGDAHDENRCFVCSQIRTTRGM